jgi:hypothetical protein
VVTPVDGGGIPLDGGGVQIDGGVGGAVSWQFEGRGGTVPVDTKEDPSIIKIAVVEL